MFTRLSHNGGSLTSKVSRILLTATATFLKEDDVTALERGKEMPPLA